MVRGGELVRRSVAQNTGWEGRERVIWMMMVRELVRHLSWVGDGELVE